MLTATAKMAALAAGLGLTAGAVALSPTATAGREAVRTLEGPQVAVANGTARTFVELGPRGEPRVWGAPHFDFHFFMVEPALIHGIRTGPCAEFIHCEDAARAGTPLPERHSPEDYVDVGAAVAGMGNHLVDAHDPEIADPTLGFSHTFIYGTYNGKLIFLEPMVSHAFLSSRAPQCRPVRTPSAYATAGYYPTTYCVRHDAASATYRVTLEGLVYRQAG